MKDIYYALYNIQFTYISTLTAALSTNSLNYIKNMKVPIKSPIIIGNRSVMILSA